MTSQCGFEFGQPFVARILIQLRSLDALLQVTDFFLMKFLKVFPFLQMDFLQFRGDSLLFRIGCCLHRCWWCRIPGWRIRRCRGQVAHDSFGDHDPGSLQAEDFSRQSFGCCIIELRRNACPWTTGSFNNKREPGFEFRFLSLVIDGKYRHACRSFVIETKR